MSPKEAGTVATRPQDRILAGGSPSFEVSQRYRGKLKQAVVLILRDLRLGYARELLGHQTEPTGRYRSSLWTGAGWVLSRCPPSVTAYSRISARVKTQICRKGSSTCSATAMNALRTGSERGTRLAVVALYGDRCSAPIWTIARMSLMTCSFSTANLLSRDKDLRAVRKVQQGGEEL